MPAYQLQIKQAVDDPRCPVYRQFIRRLMDVRNIHASESCGKSKIGPGTIPYWNIMLLAI